MTARRLVMTVALTALVAATGCQSWCQTHYPCQQPVYAQPQTYAPCNPCCNPSGYSPAPPAVSSQPGQPAWNAPRPQGPCSCQ